MNTEIKTIALDLEKKLKKSSKWRQFLSQEEKRRPSALN